MPLSLSGSCLCLWCATQLLASDNIEPLFRPTLGGAGITFCNKRPFNLSSTHSRQETMNKRLILLWNDCVSSKIFFTIFLIHQGCSPCTVERQTAPKKSSNSLTFVKILDEFYNRPPHFLILNHRDMTKEYLSSVEQGP